MMAFLSWRVWAAVALAVFLAGTHWKAYHAGGKSVQAEWDAQTLALTQAALAAEAANRAKEQVLQTKVQKVSAEYAKQKQVNADLAKSLDDSVRDFNATLNSVSTADSSTPTRDHGTGGLVNQLLGTCSATLAELAGEADRLEGKTLALQNYIKSVIEK